MIVRHTSKSVSFTNITDNRIPHWTHFNIFYSFALEIQMLRFHILKLFPFIYKIKNFITDFRRPELLKMTLKQTIILC